MYKRAVLLFVILSAQTAACAGYSDQSARRATGEAAISSACIRGWFFRDEAALEYLDFVHSEAAPGELSTFVGRDVWLPCTRSDREGRVRGRMTLVLFEKGTESEIREHIRQLSSPDAFCLYSPAAYGREAEPRIRAACEGLGLTGAE